MYMPVRTPIVLPFHLPIPQLCTGRLQEYRIHNCELLFKEDIGVDDLIDLIEGNRRYVKCLYVYNKVSQRQQKLRGLLTCCLGHCNTDRHYAPEPGSADANEKHFGADASAKWSASFELCYLQMHQCLHGHW
jgi:hypothetical protein